MQLTCIMAVKQQLVGWYSFTGSYYMTWYKTYTVLELSLIVLALNLHACIFVVK